MRWVQLIYKCECTNCHTVRHSKRNYFSASRCNYCNSLAFGLNKIEAEYWKAIDPKTKTFLEY